MKTILHKASSRGHAQNGWLDSYHSFSFADYHHPDRMNFGVLRVLNDDCVAPGNGFGNHPHSNMEIISIPLAGDLEHKDSMGNVAIIRQGDIQALSAGTGIYHSEYNKNKDKEVRFLQIWIFPKLKQVAPRYDQVSLRSIEKKNQFYQILSPNPADQGVWIHQDVWFHLGKFQNGIGDTYRLKQTGNGVYIFVLEGSIVLGGQVLDKRDGFGLWDADSFEMTAIIDSKVLLMEVPMAL
ncbi:MAG: pirin family protein [Cyclobacteriaceae bacterium]|nr:pirin family protein [Cyclobacteriaceae bacterium]